MPNNNMNFGVDVLPVADSTYELGSSSKKWNNVYADSINGVAFAHWPPYAESSTDASTQVKTVSIDGITSLSAGLSIRVKFANAQSYDGVPKLNLNSLGEKNIMRNAATSAALNEWGTGEVLDLVYDGTNWILVNGGGLKFQ